MGRSSKGSSFERELCKALDKWWTGSEDEAVFWRSAQSGGRATTRSAKGKHTHGSYGDISAVSPIGEPLVDVFTLELKRGYTKHHIAELFDLSDYHRENQNTKQFEEFLNQASNSGEQAGSLSWMLVHKRDGKQIMVYFPWWVFRRLQQLGAFKPAPVPLMRFRCFKKGGGEMDLAAMRFQSFLDGTCRDHIEQLSND